MVEDNDRIRLRAEGAQASELPEADRSRVFSRQGGTIGRASDNHWTLPDDQRLISGQHLRIIHTGDEFVAEDVSTNGTFVNDNGQPIGHARREPLRIGDRLTVGRYRLVVEAADPATGGMAVDDLDDLLETPATARTASTSHEPDADADSARFSDDALVNPDDADPLRALNRPSSSLDGDSDLEATLRSSTPPPDAARTVDDHAPEHTHAYRPPAAIPDDWDAEASDAPDNEQAAFDTAAHTSDIDESETDHADTATPYADSTPAAPEAAAPVDDQRADSAPSGAPHTSRPAPSSGTAGPIPGVPHGARLSGADEFVAQPAAPDEPQSRPTPDAAMDTRDPAAPAEAGESRAPRGDVALDALLEGLGIEGHRIDPEATSAFCRNVGQLLRAHVEGLIDELQGRAKFQRQLRLPGTQMQARHNNPLKLSVDADEAVFRLIVEPGRRGYMPPLQAVRSAFEDLRRHDAASRKATRVAAEALLAQFDPNRLDPSLVDDISSARGQRKQFWPRYRTFHEKLTQQAQTQGVAVPFRDAFAEAYERSLHSPDTDSASEDS